MQKDKNIVSKASNNLRILIAAMVEKAKSGHPGGAMGGADFINVLFSEYMNYDNAHEASNIWRARDRFFLDPGHMAPMLYSQLCLCGKYSLEDLQNLRQWGSITPGHPEIDVLHGVENTSGPLGQGHTFAVGAAIAAKWMHQRFGEIHNPTIYAYISDGGVQEEISQGAGRLAGYLQLDNLVMYYDSNDVQLSTYCHEVTSENVKQKYEAWGWEVVEIDGHNIDQIRTALDKSKQSKKPFLIIGHTAMGKGAVNAEGESWEGKCSTHGQPLSKSGADFNKTIENLGGNPNNPFVIFDDVKELYQKRDQEITNIIKEYNAKYDQWSKANPDLAKQYDAFFEKKLPDMQWESVVQKDGSATRSASATVLKHLAQKVDNMIVASADLSNSDKTDGFLSQTHALAPNDFSGQFLQAGVSELTMACVAIGMALHGGIIPACATFFVFSDYMKPAVRLACLMELPVIFVWSHDSFRVGEDGPTHEPIEQEAQIRLMEKLQNHSGKPSMLVLRPADAQETTYCWRLALENKHTPTAIILSRQDIPSLPNVQFDQTAKGGYIALKDTNPQVVLVASGAEVSTLLQATELLHKDNIQVQVVSVPSEGLFRQQPATYQQDVLPAKLPRLGLTSGLPCTLQGLVGDSGKIYGMQSFGFSAPYKVLDEKLGFTPENIYKEIKNYINGI